MAFPFGRVSQNWKFDPNFDNAFFAALLGSCGSRRAACRRAAPRGGPPDKTDTPRVLFESLEQSYLLSADTPPLTITLLDARHHLAVHCDRTQLVVSNHQHASRPNQVQIVGSNQDDRLNIELTEDSRCRSASSSIAPPAPSITSMKTSAVPVEGRLS